MIKTEECPGVWKKLGVPYALKKKTQILIRFDSNNNIDENKLYVSLQKSKPGRLIDFAHTSQ